MTDNQTTARAVERCSMGVGCDEAGVCYAAAYGEPDRCPLAAPPSADDMGADVSERAREFILSRLDKSDPWVRGLMVEGGDWPKGLAMQLPIVQLLIEAALRSTDSALVDALRTIARPLECGCKPCTGQCRSQEALLAHIEALQDIAEQALSAQSVESRVSVLEERKS